MLPFRHVLCPLVIKLSNPFMLLDIVFHGVVRELHGISHVACLIEVAYVLFEEGVVGWKNRADLCAAFRVNRINLIQRLHEFRNGSVGVLHCREKVLTACCFVSVVDTVQKSVNRLLLIVILCGLRSRKSAGNNRLYLIHRSALRNARLCYLCYPVFHGERFQRCRLHVILERVLNSFTIFGILFSSSCFRFGNSWFFLRCLFLLNRFIALFILFSVGKICGLCLRRYNILRIVSDCLLRLCRLNGVKDRRSLRRFPIEICPKLCVHIRRLDALIGVHGVHARSLEWIVCYVSQCRVLRYRPIGVHDCLRRPLVCKGLCECLLRKVLRRVIVVTNGIWVSTARIAHRF